MKWFQLEHFEDGDGWAIGFAFASNGFSICIYKWILIIWEKDV